MWISEYFWIAGLASFLVGLSKGGLPTVGMLAVPMLSLQMPPMTAATLLLPIFVISDGVAVYLYRHQFSAENLKRLLPAGLFGVTVGWLLAASVSDALFSLLIGLTGIGFCLSMWMRRTPKPTQTPSRWGGYLWGTLAGLTSFISHSGAPPFQIYTLPQRLPKLVFAGTSTLFFAVINAAKIYPYQNLRPYSEDVLMQATGLVPFAVLGTLVGAWATRKIHDKWFFLLVQITLFGVSVKLVMGALA